MGTELESIPGIGEKTAVELLKHFRSVKRIQTAEKKEIVEIIGNAKGTLIYNHYHAND